MARPLHWLNPIRNFPINIEDTVQQLATIRREFLTTGRLPSHAVRSVILESWQRCAPLVEPERAQVPVNIASDADLREPRSAHEPFLLAAAPVVTRVDRFSGRVRLYYRVSESAGSIVAGQWRQDARGLAGTDRAGARRRLERSGGRHERHRHGARHWPVSASAWPQASLRHWQDITCITAPIRDPWRDEYAGVLDISGDYHLVRPFFAGILTAAALEIKQNLSDLLGLRGERTTPFQIAILSFSSSRLGRAAAQILPPVTVSRPAAFDAADLQTQLDYQEHRACAAERLALATGAVSACLDLNMTLERVAEQTAHLLELDSGAACIFDEWGKAVSVRAYAQSRTQSGEALQAMQAVLHQTALVNALRECGEPILIDDVRTAMQLSDRSIEQHGVRALALLPLTGAQHVIGFILAPRAAPYRWRAEDLNLRPDLCPACGQRHRKCPLV